MNKPYEDIGADYYEYARQSALCLALWIAERPGSGIADVIEAIRNMRMGEPSRSEVASRLAARAGGTPG